MTTAESASVLGIGWRARGDKKPEEKRIPFNRPTVRQVSPSGEYTLNTEMDSGHLTKKWREREGGQDGLVKLNTKSSGK